MCFDLECRKPKAPQCKRCFNTCAISRVHALAKAEGVCQLVAAVAEPPLVQPQHLQSRQVYRLGALKLHESNLLQHYRGRV